jgi:beta-1,4-mannosyltransferase
VLALVIRVLIQTMQMLWTMCVALPRPTHVLLQTPPCVPSFAVCALVCFVRRAKFVIDWHNFAYTLMALKMGGARSPLVRLAKIYEKTMGRLGHAHFAVTNAMATWLEEEWGIEVRWCCTTRRRISSGQLMTKRNESNCCEGYSRL